MKICSCSLESEMQEKEAWQLDENGGGTTDVRHECHVVMQFGVITAIKLLCIVTGRMGAQDGRSLE